MTAFLANIGLEAAVVGVVCIVYMILFVVSGIRSVYMGHHD